MASEEPLFDPSLKKKKKKSATTAKDLATEEDATAPATDPVVVDGDAGAAGGAEAPEKTGEFDDFGDLKKKKKKKKVVLDDEAEAGDEKEATKEVTQEEKPKEGDGDDEFADLKKKKKKKKSVALDLEMEGEGIVTPGPTATTETDKKEKKADGDDEFGDLKKKKKKKKTAEFDLEKFEQELQASSAKPAKKSKDPSGAATPDGGAEDVGDGLGDEEPDGENVFGDKGAGGGDDDDDEDDDEGGEEEEELGEDASPFIRKAKEKKWLQEEGKDYAYDELLGRFYLSLYASHPSLNPYSASSGATKRYTLAPPQLFREGNKKSVFANVAEICKKMHRQPEHVISFLFAELGTTGSVDASSRLVIRGRFQQKQIENVLRRYIIEYVTCRTCRSPDTLLSKDNRIYFVTCETCGSRRSVSAIKAGFVAQVGKRKNKG